MDIKLATDAGLSQSEIAQALGVSRVTVNLWVNGKMSPHPLHYEKVKHRFDLLLKAVEANLIPPKSRKRSPRHEAIEQAITKLITQ